MPLTPFVPQGVPPDNQPMTQVIRKFRRVARPEPPVMGVAINDEADTNGQLTPH